MSQQAYLLLGQTVTTGAVLRAGVSGSEEKLHCPVAAAGRFSPRYSLRLLAPTETPAECQRASLSSASIPETLAPKQNAPPFVKDFVQVSVSASSYTAKKTKITSKEPDSRK